MVDVERFRDPGAGPGRIVGIETQGTGIAGLTAEVDGIRLYLSPAFLDDVLGGFQTIESTRDQILAFAGSWARQGGRSFEGSVDDALALLNDPEALARADYVSLPLGVFDALRRRQRD